MDLDAVVKKYHTRITALEQFVANFTGTVPAGGATTALEQILPVIHKAIADAQAVVADFNQIVTAFQPTFAWVQSQIAAEEARKANREAAVAAGEHVEERAPEVGPGNAVDHQGAQTA